MQGETGNHPGQTIPESLCDTVILYKRKILLDSDQMKHLLDDLRQEFDYILVDSPAGIDQGFYLPLREPTAL